MGCEGSKIEYEDIMPPELQALRKKIAAYTSGKMGQTATALPEGFPLSAQVNPLQTNAANIMNMLMGGGVMGNTGYNTSPGGYGGAGAGGGTANTLQQRLGGLTGKDIIGGLKDKGVTSSFPQAVHYPYTGRSVVGGLPGLSLPRGSTGAGMTAAELAKLLAGYKV